NTYKHKSFKTMLEEASEEVRFRLEINSIIDDFLLGQETVKKLSVLLELQKKLETRMVETNNEYYCKVGIIVEERREEIWSSYMPKQNEKIASEDTGGIPIDAKVKRIFSVLSEREAA
ncbi:MAG: hypothetical protein JW812_03665, partial [Alphaproteobacteria bacterium]|nr:hypothetical protein [Alphaproteobacteria bacterium]